MQWSVVKHRATLEWLDWQWECDLENPKVGVVVMDRRFPNAQAWQLLVVQPTPEHACRLEDWFARGSDLMLRYGQTSTDSFSFQIDYRVVDADELDSEQIGWDWWLSVQTQLLNSHPALEIANSLPVEAWRAVNQRAQGSDKEVAMLIGQCPEGSVAIMVHPSDLAQSACVGSTESPKLRLFGSFMEKGVIRRARLRCLLSRQTLSDEQLREAYQRFAQVPLPLTT